MLPYAFLATPIRWIRHAGRTTFIAAGAVLLSAACRSAGGWTPDDPAAFDRLTIERHGKLGSTQRLRLGPYTADSIDVSWGRGRGDGVRLGGIGADGATTGQEYRFVVAGSELAALSVACRSTASERSVAVRSVDLQASVRLALDCSLRDRESGSAGQLAVSAGGDAAFEGSLTMEGMRLLVTAQTEGSRVLGRRPRSFEFREAGGGSALATLDVRDGVLWLARGAASDPRRLAITGASAALLIYQKPTD